jgi:hypothetical protein
MLRFRQLRRALYAAVGAIGRIRATGINAGGA